MDLVLRAFALAFFTGFLVDFLAMLILLMLESRWGMRAGGRKTFIKKLGRGTLGTYPGAAAFALFIGYVLSECSGVTVKKLTDRGQLLLLLGGLLLGRLLGLLGLLLRSHVQLLYRLFGSERLSSPPKTSSI